MKLFCFLVFGHLIAHVFSPSSSGFFFLFFFYILQTFGLITETLQFNKGQPQTNAGSDECVVCAERDMFPDYSPVRSFEIGPFCAHIIVVISHVCAPWHTQTSSLKAIKFISVGTAFRARASSFYSGLWLELDLVLSKQWAPVYFQLAWWVQNVLPSS